MESIEASLPARSCNLHNLDNSVIVLLLLGIHIGAQKFLNLNMIFVYYKYYMPYPTWLLLYRYESGCLILLNEINWQTCQDVSISVINLSMVLQRRLFFIDFFIPIFATLLQLLLLLFLVFQFWLAETQTITFFMILLE